MASELLFRIVRVAPDYLQKIKYICATHIKHIKRHHDTCASNYHAVASQFIICEGTKHFIKYRRSCATHHHLSCH